jgi:cytochrome c
MSHQFLLQPTSEYISLLSTLVYLMLMFHLPYLGMVLGSSVLSAAYNKWKPALSKELIDLALGKPWVWIGFGLLPAAALAFLYKMQTANMPVPVHLYLLRLSAAAAVGFVLLSIYRHTGNILAGGAGALVIFVYSFHFTDVRALLIFPEKWFFLKGLLPFPLFSITPLIHFAQFLLLSAAMTGAGILFFYYRWPEKRLPEDTPHFALLKYHGFGLLLAGSLLMPVVLFWDLFNLPNYSLSAGVFVLAAFAVVVLFLLTAAVVGMIRDRSETIPRFAAVSFILVLVVFGLMIGKDGVLQANASMETRAVLKMDAEKARNAIIAQREEIYSKNMVIDAALGEQIYTERCTACHSFDKKVLGPPFNDVLPKYAGKKDALAAFISNPVKVNPNFPSMPNPGLTPIQVKSLVKFLMGKMGMDTGKESESPVTPQLQNSDGKSETNPNDQNSNALNRGSARLSIRLRGLVLNFEHLNFEFVSNFGFRISNLQTLLVNRSTMRYRGSGNE